MTNRSGTPAAEVDPTSKDAGRRSAKEVTAPFRKRWLSRRALLLHLCVLVVAPGCVAAGWWQATRALAGNGLSWAYSVEWPIFALLAIGGWWQLIHEDEATYRARRAPRPDAESATDGTDPAAGPGIEPVERRVDARTARWATWLAVLVGLESLLGVMAVLSIPFGRPSGWVPAKGAAIYLTHAIVGAAVAVGAGALIGRVRHAGRISKAVAWAGLVGVALGGIGGLLTEPSQPVRFLGMAMMTVGALCAGASYLIPTLIGARGDGHTEGAALASPSGADVGQAGQQA